jgi:hypothetical protein
MQEYFNLDLESCFQLDAPRPIKHKNSEAGLLQASYTSGKRKDPLVIMTPPLRCVKVRVWPPQAQDHYDKCELDLEVTENEWRFSHCLGDIGEACRNTIAQNGRDWFGYAFSTSALLNAYTNLDVPTKNTYMRKDSDQIRIRLGKAILSTLDRTQAKSWRNQFLVLRMVFRGVLVKEGKFSEIWRSDQVLKATPTVLEEDTESEGEDLQDVDTLEDLVDPDPEPPKRTEKKKKKPEKVKVEKIDEPEPEPVAEMGSEVEEPPKELHSEPTEEPEPETEPAPAEQDPVEEPEDEVKVVQVEQTSSKKKSKTKAVKVEKVEEDEEIPQPEPKEKPAKKKVEKEAPRKKSGSSKDRRRSRKEKSRKEKRKKSDSKKSRRLILSHNRRRDW